MNFNTGIPTKIWNWYIQKRMDWASEKSVYPNVKWLSHHIPKTAGTSFYYTLENEFGIEGVWRAYDHFKLGRKLTQGKPVYVPSKAKVVHGHFRPHDHHHIYFPNAQRIVWFRDPLETAWSWMRHWLKYKEGETYEYIHEKYIKDKNPDLETLFECLLKDEKTWHPTRIFSAFLQNSKREDFAFVGRVSHYEEDLKRLSEVMGTPLKSFQENINVENKDLPFDRDKFKSILQTEYDFIDQWISEGNT